MQFFNGGIIWGSVQAMACVSEFSGRLKTAVGTLHRKGI